MCRRALRLILLVQRSHDRRDRSGIGPAVGFLDETGDDRRKGGLGKEAALDTEAQEHPLVGAQSAQRVRRHAECVRIIA